MAQITSGLRRALSNSLFYESFQRLLGATSLYKTYVNEYIKPNHNSNILDIGCGTSAILKYLPNGVNYTGYDLSSTYISTAEARFGQRGKWFCADAANMDLNEASSYDIVMANGLFHHLNDEECTSLACTASKALKPEGVFFSIDACYTDKQSPIARLIINKDRGQNIRYAYEYQKNLFDYFSCIQVYIRSDLLRIPYAHAIIIASQPKDSDHACKHFAGGDNGDLTSF